MSISIADGFKFELGAIGAALIVHAIAAAFLVAGVTLVVRNNEPGTKPLRKLRGAQIAGLVLIAIGSIPFLNVLLFAGASYALDEAF